MSSGSLPAAPPQNPGFPQNPNLFVFEGFSTLNTKPTRQGIKDQEMYICDGFIPLGENNLRTMPGLGDPLYTWDNLNTIQYFAFGAMPIASILGSILTPVCFAFIGHGGLAGAVQISQQSPADIVTMIPFGQISFANPGTVAVAQWGNQYALTVSTVGISGYGYWIWDGASTFAKGTLSPTVVLTDSGSNYTGAPTVSASGGSGTGAQFSASIANGSVTGVKVTNPGSGYVIGDTPTIRFSGGGSDTQALATAGVSSGAGVTAVVVQDGGSGYSAAAAVSASGGGGTGAQFLLIGNNGVITAVQIANPGSGYTSPPFLNVLDSSGSGAILLAVIKGGQIVSATVDDGGSGYITPPTVIVNGDGTGAEITASIVSGAVDSLMIVSPGTGYTQATLSFTGGNNAASGTIAIMPFGIKGNSVEIYQGRVWIADKNVVQYSSPGDPADFNPANGAGFFISSDSYLRYAYVCIKQSNGFLYLLGDSSIDYISNVNTAGTPPITTFSKLNVDPQIGVHDPYSDPNVFGVQGDGGSTDSVALFSRNLIFTGHNGVYASYGGAVNKISNELDGLYGPVTGTASELIVSSTAVANIYGVQCFMFLQTIADPANNGVQTNKLFLWDGKRWWTSNQNWAGSLISPQFIASDTNFMAYYTDGHQIIPMFQTAVSVSSGFTKTVQSKLWYRPNLFFTKTAQGFLAATSMNSVSAGTTVTISVDTEVQTSAITYTVSAAFGSSTPIIIQAKPPANSGQEIGMTIATTAKDMTLVSGQLMTQLKQTIY